MKKTICLLGLVLAVSWATVGLAQEEPWKKDANLQNAKQYFMQGIESGIQGKFEEASELFKRTLEISPAISPAEDGRVIAEDAKSSKIKKEAAIHLFRGLKSGETTEFDQAIALEPNYAQAYYLRGQTYSFSGENDKAMLDFSKTIELNPTHSSAYEMRGMSYLYEKKYDQGIADLDKAIKIKPDLAVAYYSRAQGLYFKGQYDKARADVKKAQELGYPVNPMFIQMLDKASMK